jgi:hypothetical protein
VDLPGSLVLRVLREHTESAEREDDWFTASIALKFRNAGRTFASDVITQSTMIFAGEDLVKVAERQYERWRNKQASSGIDFMSEEHADSWGKRSCCFDQVPWIADRSGKRTFFLVCTAVYYRIPGDPADARVA